MPAVTGVPIDAAMPQDMDLIAGLNCKAPKAIFLFISNACSSINLGAVSYLIHSVNFALQAQDAAR